MIERASIRLIMPAVVLLATAAVLFRLAPAADAAPDRPAAAKAASKATAMAVLRDNCLNCHNAEKHKGGLSLATREAALRGNDNGAALAAGRAADSALVRVLAPDADPHMPPKRQLAAEEVAAVRDWVDAGAPWDEQVLAAAAGEPTTRPVVLGDLPAAYQPVLAVALSPDEKRLAIGRGARVYVHDLARPGRPVTDVFDGPRDAVQSLAWSPDGNLIAAGDYGQVIVRDLRGAKPPVTLGGLAGRVTALLFLPDGATLLAADGEPGRSGRLCRFRLPETEPRATVPAHGDTILALRGTRDGSLVASAGADKLVKLWDPRAMTETARLEGHSGHVLGLAFKADDSLLATAGTDREVKVWDVKTREQKATVGPYPAAVTALAWPGDGGKGGKVLAGCEDGTVRQGTETAVGPPMPDTAADVIYSLAVTADGKHLYGGCHDGLVYVWGAGGKLEGKLSATAAAPEPTGGK